MGDHDQPQVLDPAAVAVQRSFELIEGFTGVRSGIDERQGLVLDQVAVDAADGERCGDAEAVYSCPGGSLQ
jgi:hypothetical protein